jgi:hypothetical protein
MTGMSVTREKRDVRQAARIVVDIVLFILVFALLTGIWAYLWVPPPTF